MVESSLTRRQVARGAAWVTPAILGTSMIPAYAASATCQTGSFIAPAPATTSAEAITTRWTVPAGVKRICVTVLGGGGGRSFLAGMEGGGGAQITAELPVTAGQVLTLVVAAGGAGSTGAPMAGGGGYGAGGNVLEGIGDAYQYSLNQYSGSGGGGSAILLGSGATATPLIVAGGGGGGGFYGRWSMRQPGITPRPWVISQRLAAGSATMDGGVSSVRMQDYAMSIATGGGMGAKNGVPGTGGINIQELIDRTNGAVQVNELKKAPGLTGASGFNARGADSVPALITHASSTIAVRSGAGGGGYGGGGSGSTVAIATTADGALASVVLGASGGGGGNYVYQQAEKVVIGTGTNGGTARDVRNPGAILINF